AARRLIRELKPQLAITQVMGNKGFHYFESRRTEIARSSRKLKFLIFLDGDELGDQCAGEKILEWFGELKPRNIYLRFAFQEVENWILADRQNISSFLGVSDSRIPHVDDNFPNAKEALINAARGSRIKAIREDLVPHPRHSSRVGPAYNPRMVEYLT